MFMAKLESWRKRNVRSPIHGDAGKKRMNIPRTTITSEDALKQQEGMTFKSVSGSPNLGAIITLSKSNRSEFLSGAD